MAVEDWRAGRPLSRCGLMGAGAAVLCEGGDSYSRPALAARV